MSRIKVRCLGGFEVWRGDRMIGGFESQKVRALFSYLVASRSRSLSRDHLAALLWPERGDESARRNLRQAVYNLKSTLAGDGETAAVVSGQGTIEINPGLDVWLDVEAFENALARGNPEGGAVDLQALGKAAQLYRGDFLADFAVKDSAAFEEWLVGEQERLRDAAVQSLRTLVDSYLARGEFRFGIQFALRLVRLDPLSEEAHRQLMHLYALSGQRSKALAQFEELRTMLSEELGIEPLADTTQLYEAIVLETTLESPAAAEAGPIGPLIPLVGRADDYGRLKRSWEKVLAGEGRITLVRGEAGGGKTRLIKSFVDAATSRRRARVLKGRCYGMSPAPSCQPFAEVIANALAGPAPAVDPELLAELVRLTPALAAEREDLPAPAATPLGRQQDLFANVAGFLTALPGLEDADDEGGVPVIVLLDDLHLADRATLRMLEALAGELAGSRVWVLGAYRPQGLGFEHPLELLGEKQGAGAVDRVHLERLSEPAVDEIAISLVGDDHADALATFLNHHGQGLPLQIAELINLLWDEGVLEAVSATRWSLTRPLSELGDPPEDLAALILRRVRQLPNSTRRLLALAAVMGQRFETELLCAAADEHPVVVEVGIELMVQRWLVRQYASDWSDNRRERDIVQFAGGARRGVFEFAHDTIRSTVHGDVNPLRRQVMHREIAFAIEQNSGDDNPEMAQELAAHFTAGGVWERALHYLEISAERALELADDEGGEAHYRRATQVIERLLSQAVDPDEQQRWRRERQRIERLLAELEAKVSRLA